MSNVNTKLLSIAFALCAVPLLSGCPAAFNPIGSNSYDCNRKQDPSSIYCHSFKAVEASTNGELPPSRFDSDLNFSQYDKATDIAPVRQRDAAASPIRSGSGEPVTLGSGGAATQGSARSETLNAAAVDGMPDGMPVREGPVIQRTWIKHFVDGNDMLTSDTTVYKEIVRSRWSGFDGGNPAGAARGVYPHKPADSKTPEAPRPSQPPQPDTPQRTDFIQPGPQASAGESSPGNSLPSSMPQ